MRVPRFRWLPARSVAEAAAVLAAEGPAAMLLAGGTDLLPNMKRRQQLPRVVVGLRGVGELRARSRDGGGGLVLGAGVTLTELGGDRELATGPYRALQLAADKVATPHIRNMATLGGNLCLDTRCNYYDQSYEWRQAIDFCKKAPGPAGVARREVTEGTCWVAPGSPRCWAVSSSDTAPALLALGAEVTLVSAGGERRLALTDLYHDDGMAYLTRRPDEVLTRVEVPALDPAWRSTYWKLRRRGSFDFPVLSVAAAVRLGTGGVVEEARIALGSVASRPNLLAVEPLLGRPLGDEAIAAFADRAVKPARPLDNTDFELSWRKKVAREYLIGALRELRGDDPATLGLLYRTAARLPVLS